MTYNKFFCPKNGRKQTSEAPERPANLIDRSDLQPGKTELITNLAISSSPKTYGEHYPVASISNIPCCLYRRAVAPKFGTSAFPSYPKWRWEERGSTKTMKGIRELWDRQTFRTSVRTSHPLPVQGAREGCAPSFFRAKDYVQVFHISRFIRLRLSTSFVYYALLY